MAANTLRSNSPELGLSCIESNIVKREEPDEGRLPLSHGEGSRHEAPLERRNAIIPDAWLDVDEFEIVKDGIDSNMICFGMATGFSFKSLVEDSHHSHQACPSDTKIRLTPKGKLFRLEDDHDVELGEVEARTVEILEALSIPNISLQLFSTPKQPQKEWVRTQVKRKSRTETFLSLSLIIYGPMELCEAVGLFATECGIALQDPTRPVRNVMYRNPHLLMEPNEKALSTSILLDTGAKQGIETAVSKNDLTFLTAANLFPETYTLEETETPWQIETQLLRHQKQGLTFLLNREKDISLDSDGRYLWFRKVFMNSHVSYINTITGNLQTGKPKCFRGGLLADDMGMGKTLQMLSLIASDRNSILEQFAGGLSPAGLRKSSATLVVVPLALIHLWIQHVTCHIGNGTMQWSVFYGPKRGSIEKHTGNDLVITTYQTLASEYKKDRSLDKSTTPYEIFWHRIVLDEAHVIANGATLVSKAICRLQAERRWVVAGTPVQNSLEDLGPLLEFLKASPFDNKKTFLTEIVKPARDGKPEGLIRLKALMGVISLRRTRKILAVPDTLEIMRRLQFNSAEERAYSDTRGKASEAVTTNNDGFVLMKRITKLRRTCNHALLEPKVGVDISHLTLLWNPGNAQDAYFTMLDNDAAKCSVCGRNLRLFFPEDAYRSSYHELYKCLHLQCNHCIVGLPIIKMENVGCTHVPNCPSHQVRNLPPDTSTVALNQSGFSDDLDPEQMPTKIRALMDDICESECGEKKSVSRSTNIAKRTLIVNRDSVVYSCWTTTLDLIEAYMSKLEINCIKVDGSISEKEKHTRLNNFQKTSNIQVLLISYGAMRGVDLTSASRVHILEPQWNVHSEEQAIGRLSRIGQTKSVKFVRNHQARKRQLGKLVLGDHTSHSDVGLEALRKIIIDS